MACGSAIYSGGLDNPGTPLHRSPTEHSQSFGWCVLRLDSDTAYSYHMWSDNYKPAHFPSSIQGPIAHNHNPGSLQDVRSEDLVKAHMFGRKDSLSISC